MEVWKGKVADKLSRLLADSPASPPPNVPDESPVARSEPPKSKPLSKDVPFGSEKSLSSYLLSFLPRSSSDGFRSNKHQTDSKSLRSLPFRWKRNSFSWKEKRLESKAENEPVCESEELLENYKEDEVGHALERRTSDVYKHDGAPTSHISYLMDESSFISSDLCEFLYASLPNIVKGCQWILLYSTLRHGISLRTLLRKSVDLPGPCLLIVGDMQGAVFGGLLECPLKPTAKRKYQGTNQTFVFTTIYGEPRIFRATGANRYYYLCLNELLAFGGGGNFALCLDEDLLHGTSGPCDTFGNLCLAHSPEFELKNVELWGFAHSSQYVT